MVADFKTLDPETRCFALVGQFLQAWSAMEGSLQNAIGAALSIDARKLHILCANIRFRDKINILATLIDVSDTFPTGEKTELVREVRKLAEFSSVRNMMAHDPFHPDESNEGVEFLPVKAKGKFDLPNVVWSVDRFQTEGATIDRYRSLLENLQGRFEAKPLQYRNYAAALRPFLVDDHAWYGPPMQRNISPALLDLLTRQPQSHTDGDQAAPQANP